VVTILFPSGFKARVSAVWPLVASTVSVQPLSERISSRTRSLLHAVHTIAAVSSKVLLPNLLAIFVIIRITLGIGVVVEFHLDLDLLEITSDEFDV
jgi:hypothetical protein